MATDRAGQILGLAFAVLLVGASFAGAFAGGPAGALSPVEPAEAYIGTTEDCTNVDFAVYMFSAMLLNRGDCALKNRDTIEEIKDGNKEQERIDLYQRGLSVNASARSYLTSFNNSLADARGSVWLKVEVRVAEVLENQTDVDGDGDHDQADVRIAARNVIEDYYTRKQINLIERWNLQRSSFGYLKNLDNNESLNRVRVPKVGDSFPHSNYSTTITLINGSDKEITVYRRKTGSPAFNYLAPVAKSAGTEADNWGSTNSWNDPEDSPIVLSPDESNHTDPLQVELYETAWNTINSQSTQLLSNANTTANGLYGSYVRGNLDVSEFVSAAAQASEWSTNYSQTGYQSYAVASLASSGLSTPNLSETASMNITYTRSPGADTKLVTVEATAQSALTGTATWDVGIGDTRRIVANPANGQVRTVTLEVPTDSILMLRHNGTSNLLNSSVGSTATLGAVQAEVTAVEGQANVTETGLLYADAAPTGGWQVGQSYHPDSLSASTVMWAAENGGVEQLDSAFTIEGAQKKDGTELQTVEMREYTKRVSDFSGLQNATQNLIELREEQQARLESLGGGGGGGAWFDFDGLGGIGSVGMLAVAGGVVILLARE
jgi:hypothetical protein